jgi:hypothetical protein
VSNYPNMSYCMCENTLLAVRQITNEMQSYESLAEFTSDMGREELAAFERLASQFQFFLEMKQEMQEFDQYNLESSNA